MTEREFFTSSYEREFQTTLRVLKAYPADKADLKPHDILRSARDLAGAVAAEQLLQKGAIEGTIDFSVLGAPVPETMEGVIEQFEKNYTAAIEAIKNAPDEAFERNVTWGAYTPRAVECMWYILLDQIHHRGQFSVYLRMAGGKVPSIYGPTADEPAV